MSKVSTARFYKMPHPDWKIVIHSTYNPQYTAGGDEGLIDGILGMQTGVKVAGRVISHRILSV